MKKKIRTHQLTPEQFAPMVLAADRFYNPANERGEAHNQASQQLKEGCRWVFVRNDGWSIASPEYDQTFNLWPEDWSHAYILESGWVEKDTLPWPGALRVLQQQQQPRTHRMKPPQKPPKGSRVDWEGKILDQQLNRFGKNRL